MFNALSAAAFCFSETKLPTTALFCWVVMVTSPNLGLLQSLVFLLSVCQGFQFEFWGKSHHKWLTKWKCAYKCVGGNTLKERLAKMWLTNHLSAFLEEFHNTKKCACDSLSQVTLLVCLRLLTSFYQVWLFRGQKAPMQRKWKDNRKRQQMCV